MVSYAVRSAAASAIVIAWLLAEIALWTRRRGNIRSSTDWTFYQLAVFQLVAIDLAYVFARRGDGVIAGGPVLIVAGVVVGAAGLALRVWSIRTLGQFFNFTVVIQGSHRVVMDGPYRLVRHPSYTGLLVTRLGIGLALASWSALAAIVLIPMPAMAIRILVEERALSKALGTEYKEYAARTNRLIPHIW